MPAQSCSGVRSVALTVENRPDRAPPRHRTPKCSRKTLPANAPRPWALLPAPQGQISIGPSSARLLTWRRPGRSRREAHRGNQLSQADREPEARHPTRSRSTAAPQATSSPRASPRGPHPAPPQQKVQGTHNLRQPTRFVRACPKGHTNTRDHTRQRWDTQGVLPQGNHGLGRERRFRQNNQARRSI